MSNEHEKEHNKEQLEAIQQQVQTLSKALTEQIFLRDVLLLINTANNPYDRSIVEKLMTGTKLDEGDWTHVFDEAGKLRDLPEGHSKAMQVIYKRLRKQSNGEAKL